MQQAMQPFVFGFDVFVAKVFFDLVQGFDLY
jgi:hypothetical protein